MKTSYIRFVQSYNDPVWGTQVLLGGDSGLVRVTRNRLRKAVFEWVGFPALPFDLIAVQKRFPLVVDAELENSGDNLRPSLYKVMPLPADVESSL